MNEEQQNQGIENQIPEETKVPEEQSYIPEETQVPDSTITPEQQAISSEQPVEAPKVPQEVEEVIKETTPAKEIYVPTEETKGNNIMIYVIILILIAAAVGVAIYIFTHKKNETAGITSGTNNIELGVNAQKLGGYIINLPEKYKVSEKEGNRLVITNYVDKVQLSFEINDDYTLQEYQESIDPIKDSFKTGYGLKDLLYSHKKFESKDWFILESSDTEGFNYTFSFTDLDNSTVSILTISQISDYSGIYKELSAIVSGIRKVASDFSETGDNTEEEIDDTDNQEETDDKPSKTNKPTKKPSKENNDNTNTNNNNGEETDGNGETSTTNEGNGQTGEQQKPEGGTSSTENGENPPPTSVPPQEKPTTDDKPSDANPTKEDNTKPTTDDKPENVNPSTDETEDGGDEPSSAPPKKGPRRAPVVPVIEKPEFE